MAYPVQGTWKDEYTATFTGSTGVTPAAANWPDHAVDDVITIVATQDGGSGTLSCDTAGWVRQGTRTGTPAGGAFGQVFTKVATSARVNGSGGETIPTIKSTINDRLTLNIFCVRDADTAAPIDVVSAQTDWNNVAAIDSAAPTANHDNSLAIYTWHSDGSVQFHADIFEATQLGQYAGTGINSATVAYRQLGAAGAVPVATMHANVATEGGTSWVVVFKNKSGGKLAPDIYWSGSRVNYYGNFSVALSEAPTWYAPEQASHQFAGGFTSASLDGLTVVSSAVNNTANNAAGPNYAIGQATTLTSTENTAGAWVGMWHEIASRDMTGKFFSVEISTSGAKVLSSNRYGFKGGLIGFTDGTNYQLFRTFNGYKRWSANTPYQITVACGTATPIYSRGTLDWATITGICYLIHREGSSATAESIYVQNAFLFSSMAFAGGSSATPLLPADLPISLGPSGYRDLTLLQSSAQVQVKFPYQIGDGGTHKTVFSAAASSTEFPQQFSDVVVPSWQVTWSVPDNSAGVTVYAGASDSISFAAALMATDTAQPFTIHASSSTSATYSFSGASFVGYDVTLKTGVPCIGATFKSGGKILAKGADLTNCSISSTTATDAAINWDASGATVTSTTIDVTGTSAAYHIELGTSVTAITLADVTFSGTPGTDKVHVLATTGTVTITISGTTNLVAGDVTSAGATVVIAAPTPTLDATVLAGSRVVLYNNTTDAELDNTAPAGTSWSKQITSGASAGDSLTLHVFKEGYEEFSTTFLYSGDDATLLVTQVQHAAIQSLRTELSISDYTTITEFTLDITGTVEIDADDADGNTQKARFAIWYNGVLTTENGARYLRGALSVLSTAAFRINTATLDLKFENISATFGLNFTDTERRLYRDDGAPIYAAASAPGSIQNDYSGVPDTVETGVSGLTGAESAHIMGLTNAPSAATVASAVITAAQTTPIHSDMRKTVGTALQGDGTANDKFRSILVP